ncbi:autophagy-related protein 2 homolog A isoform X1 [Daphnia magna]|uniref:autophagy-related protein 2 homolog A isoform X1 n=1 Tax=Daphnia magna TaxID=35525 RepID=UPI001E1BBEB8|nr:autophagy-related protein 2 homolog A isoform X1 [Daphnia magna]
MPWYFPWSEAIKKRACRYLLQHYLGRFLDTKLGLDQLSVDLYKGTGCVKDVNLDVEALNDLSDEQGLPLEFLDGSISEVSVSVPWSALLSDSSFVEIKGLCLVVRPKQQCKNAFMWESMINSMIMTTSMQLAEECLKENEGESFEESQTTFEGLELFAQTLETVLARIKVRVIDTVIRLEYVPQSSLSGVGLEIHVKRMDYFDMAGQDQNVPNGHQIVNEKSAYATKKFRLEGVSIYSDEFAANQKTQSRSCSTDNSSSSGSFPESDYDIKTPDQKFSDNLILCGKLSGRHEIAIRYKQCENLLGPKMELDVTLGSSVLFFSPRQFHSFHAIFQALVLPAFEINNKSKRNEKPMQLSDYRRIENELQQQIKQATLPSVPGESLSRKGWSTGYLDDSDEEFHAFEPRPMGKMDINLVQTIQQPNESPSCETNRRTESPSVRHSKANSHFSENGCPLEEENAAVRMRFSVKLGSLVVLLIHEDIFACNSTTGQLAASSVDQMRSLANFFFDQIGLLHLVGAGIKDLSVTKEKLNTACSKSHLRFILAPVSINGTEQDSTLGTTMELNLTAAVAEILECLVEKSSLVPNTGIDSFPIIHFLPHLDGCQTKPNLHLKFISHQPGRILQKVRKPSMPEMNINFYFCPCEIEVDMSIVDRITALLNRPSFLCSPKARFNQMYQEKHISVDAVLDNDSLCQTNISVSCPKLNVKLRFPIPDLRPVHDLQRNPWWRRCLRPDVLTIVLQEVILKTTFTPNETSTTVHLVCKEAIGSYQEKANEEALKFLHAVAQDDDDVDIADGAGHYDLPRVTMVFRPSHTNGIELEDQDETDRENDDDADVMTMSTGEALLGITAEQPSPFSKQRRIHKGQNHRDEGAILDELVIPGDSEETSEFITLACKMCLTQIDISLPKATLLLPSKQFFETIYNRLSTDLCLWEPSAPEYFASHGKPFHETQTMSNFSGLGSAVLQSPIPNMFIMCKSGVAYESDSESDEDGNEAAYTYRKSRPEQLNGKGKMKSSPSKMCVLVNIGKGSGTLFCHIKDSFGGDSVTHHGEIQFCIENGRFFSVTGFKGDDQTGHICFHASKASLSHNGYVLNSYEDLGDHPSSRLHQTSRVDQVIYPSPSDTRVGREQVENGPMISLAIKIHNDTRQHVKTFKTAIAVQGGILRHRFAPPTQSWFNQLIDFLDVVDYPIAGYCTPTVITELHLNISDCGIDYRPLYLPARAFLSVGAVNVSSNIMALTNSSVLRFVVEDACLYLSNRVSYGTVNLQRDYVCVLEIDLIELSLRLREKQEEAGDPSRNNFELPETKLPFFELQASLNLIRLRTCADSCRLLLDLMKYLAEDGDFDEKGIAMSEDSSESGVLLKSGLNSAVGGSLSSLCEQEKESQVNDLMAEAMRDSSPVQQRQSYKSQPKEESVANTTEVFFFPDENQIPIRNVNLMNYQKGSCGNRHQDIAQQLMDEALDPECDDCPKTEEEFCILENDPGVGFTPRGGEPHVRQLMSASVQVVDGHFSPPIGKIDVLKAPKNFPVPVMRYVLGEMTLIWEIFGGQDFSKSTSSSNASSKSKFHKTVSFTKRKDSPEQVKFCPSADGKNTSQPIGKRPNDWHRCQNMRGGYNRQQDVKLELQMNKVRLIHEVYPDDTFQASRQVLTIADIEIRDRLAESHINKLLYQYCCEARPRQAHANMVLVKALHIRPDLRLPALECCLKVSILPLRLHLDQDTLAFMTDFFASMSEVGCHDEEDGGRSAMNGPIPVPIMGLAGDVVSPSPCPREFTHQRDSVSTADSNDLSISPPVYFRSFTFSPDVLIRFDYHGKGVDLSQGPSFSGLLVGLGQLNCSQLTLKRLSHRHGLLGIHKLIAYALNEWLIDIKKNQLPSIMAGVGPMHSIVQLVQGIRDLFWLPVEQFQKDGRIVRGLQRGANAFSTSAALAILELTSRVVQTLQSAAETAYDVVSPGPSVRRSRTGSRGRRRRQVQPVDIRDGVAKAYQVVKEGLGETAQTLVRVANEEAEQKGMTGAVGGVLRQIPPIVVKPIILATEATFNVIGGVQSQLMPDTRKEACDKWRRDD